MIINEIQQTKHSQERINLREKNSEVVIDFLNEEDNEFLDDIKSNIKKLVNIYMFKRIKDSWSVKVSNDCTLIYGTINYKYNQSTKPLKIKVDKAEGKGHSIGSCYFSPVKYDEVHIEDGVATTLMIALNEEDALSKNKEKTNDIIVHVPGEKKLTIDIDKILASFKLKKVKKNKIVVDKDSLPYVPQGEYSGRKPIQIKVEYLEYKKTKDKKGNLTILKDKEGKPVPSGIKKEIKSFKAVSIENPLDETIVNDLRFTVPTYTDFVRVNKSLKNSGIQYSETNTFPKERKQKMEGEAKFVIPTVYKSNYFTESIKNNKTIKLLEVLEKLANKKVILT